MNCIPELRKADLRIEAHSRLNRLLSVAAALDHTAPDDSTYGDIRRRYLEERGEIIRRLSRS